MSCGCEKTPLSFQATIFSYQIEDLKHSQGATRLSTETGRFGRSFRKIQKTPMIPEMGKVVNIQLITQIHTIYKI